MLGEIYYLKMGIIQINYTIIINRKTIVIFKVNHYKLIIIVIIMF